MNKFKEIMMLGHTQRKEYLHKLYTDRQIYISSLSSSEQPVEDERIFYYGDLSFQFKGTGFRTTEKMVMYIYIPEKIVLFEQDIVSDAVAYEDYLLRMISSDLNQLSQSYKNDRKSAREKPEFAIQSVNSVVQKRNGCIYLENRKVFRIRVHFTFPLINGISLDGKSSFKAIRDIMKIISNKLMKMEKSDLKEHIHLYREQMEIRKFLKDNGFVAFVGNGAILPRNGEKEEPKEQAVPFLTPDELRLDIKMSDGKIISGMGIKKGITVITGGGYSGKSTLLDSLEMGIYHHIRGDGREYVITDCSGCKIYAEDGRYVRDMNISPFFTNLPGNMDINHFSTYKASGSVSQAANIIEAVYGECKLLMIDEDTSATNFMIRDKNMRFLVKNEPIIPFTDRVGELSDIGISTILVIGGSSEYLKYADTVILMDDFIPKDETEYVKQHIVKTLEENYEYDNRNSDWTRRRYWNIEKTVNDFYYAECVQIENARYIKIDDWVTDITKMTAIISDQQINSLTYLLEKLICCGKADRDLLETCKELTEYFLRNTEETILSNGQKYELWFEDIRPMDLLMAVNRMRFK